MLLRIYELCENGLIKGPTFDMGFYENVLTRLKWNDVAFWKSNAWTKCVEYTICSLVKSAHIQIKWEGNARYHFALNNWLSCSQIL